LYELFWHDFADWYLELSKVTLRESLEIKNRTGSEVEMRNTERVLASLLKQMLVLLHPFAPFVTEELFSLLDYPKRGQKSITEESWEKLLVGFGHDQKLGEQMSLFQQIVMNFRNLRYGHYPRQRSQMQIQPSQKAPCGISFKKSEDLSFFNNGAKPYLSELIKASTLEMGLNLPVPSHEEARIQSLGTMTLFIKVKEMNIEVDINAERENVDKQIKDTSFKLSAVLAQLDNTEFMAKAPEAVKAKVKERQKQYESQIEELEKRRKNLGI
jgi:valyl-tRNA synthetase